MSNKSEKKGRLTKLFGAKEKSCCNMEIVEEPDTNSCCCADSKQQLDDEILGQRWISEAAGDKK